MRSRALAVAAVLMLVVSAVAGVAGIAAASSSAPPNGMVGLADSQIQDKRPNGIQRNTQVSASDLEGSVYVSKHASTTEVDIVTGGQADAVAHGKSIAEVRASPNAPSADDGPRFALVISDDANHEGRRVAIDVDKVRQAFGFVPEQLTVRNSETGEQWQYPTHVEDGWLVVEVEHFSSNSVTFSGTFSATGTYTNGSSISYQLSDLDAAKDYQINVTGIENTETDTENGTATPSGSSSISIGGTADPTGPNGSPTLTVTDKSGETDQNPNPAGTRQITSWSDGSVDEWRFKVNAPDAISNIEVNITSVKNIDPLVVDVYLSDDEDTMADSITEGTLIRDNWDISSAGLKSWSFPVFQTDDGVVTVGYDIVQGSNTVTNRFYQSMTYLANGQKWDAKPSTDTTSSEKADIRLWSDPITGLSADADDGTSKSIGDFSPGESKSVDFPVTDAANSISWSSSGGAALDWELNYTERTVTDSPTVEVNGNTTSYSGTLSAGTTTSLTADTSWLRSGTNRVNVSLPSLSADAPPMQVDLDYSHRALNNQTVDYTGEKWTERYHVSKSYSSDRNNAKLTIPFAGNVVEIRDVTVYKNGAQVSPTSTSLANTELEVGLGDLAAGDTVRVVANGSKVVTGGGGGVQVLEPTMMGQRLDSRIELKNWSASAFLGVRGTEGGAKIHYAYNESWDGADEYAKVTPSTQRLFMPNAGTGSRARVSTIPLEAQPDANEVLVSVAKAGANPRISVEPGQHDGDTVTYTYLDTVSGTNYLLYSLTNDVQRDSATAHSPVALTDDDSAELLQIMTGSNASASGTGSGGGAVVPPISTSSPFGVPIALVAAIVGLAALALAGQRAGLGTMGTLGLVGAGGLLSLLLLGEAFSPTSLLETLVKPVAEGLGSISAFAGMVAILLAAWYAYANYIKGRDGPTIEIVGRRLK